MHYVLSRVNLNHWHQVIRMLNMDKYKAERLKVMAQVLLQAKRNNDDRYFSFLMSMAINTGKSVKYIEIKIVEYANART